MVLTAEYSKEGYGICLDGRLIYLAGNHPQDSFYFLDVEDPLAMPLSEILTACTITMGELAEEQGGTIGKIELVSELRW